MNLIQSMGGLTRTEVGVREYSLSLSEPLGSWDSSFFLHLDWNLNHGFPESPAYQLQNLGLVGLHNHVSEFLMTPYDTFLSLHIHTFYWSWRTHTDRRCLQDGFYPIKLKKSIKYPLRINSQSSGILNYFPHGENKFQILT